MLKNEERNTVPAFYKGQLCPSAHLSKIDYYLSCDFILLTSKSYLILTSRIWQRRQWHPTPVLLPGKSHGRRSLEGCSPWVAEGRTRLSDFTLTFHFHALEKEMATHSSVLAWRIPGTGDPGGLLSMGLHRVRHDWSDWAAAAAAAVTNEGLPWWLRL